MTVREINVAGGSDHVIDLSVRALDIDGNDAEWKGLRKIGSRGGAIGMDGAASVASVCRSVSIFGRVSMIWANLRAITLINRCI